MTKAFEQHASVQLRLANSFGHDMTRDEYKNNGTSEWAHYCCLRCGANLNIRRDGTALNRSITSATDERCRGRQ
jgi:hypothetical protein